MNGTWGVYEVRGRLPDGKETATTDRAATRFFVRWRVNGRMRRRTFATRTQAKQWRETLIAAKNQGWDADERGWPVNPTTPPPPTPVDKEMPPTPGHTFETYAEQVWWPAVSPTMGDKSRIGHRRNLDLAVELLRLPDGDPRLRSAQLTAGASLPLAMWTSDDTKAALAARRSINGRTAAQNTRRLHAATSRPTSAVDDVPQRPETASASTVWNFRVTLGMVAKAAIAAGHVALDPMADTAAFAPKPRPTRRRTRLVPTLDELFDVADAISRMGPFMRDGRHRGARFESLVLVAGTTGARPGELAAHRPGWIDWGTAPSEIRFHRTEAAVYGAVLHPEERGRRERALKHQLADEFRTVPLIRDVEAALSKHLEHGYSSPQRTWLSPTGRGHLDFGNLRDDYWRPAMEAVFAGTAKAALVNASFKILRKTAITWWADSGINQAQAAEWAGHSEEVARVYYASRANLTFEREVALLETHRRPPRH